MSSLKDSSLHSSLWQPAFDLVQTIIVSDDAALLADLLNDHTPLCLERIIPVELSDNDDDGLPL